jgi:excisionase family DNA binding protein
MTIDEAIQAVVVAALHESLAPYLRRLADPEPLVYSVREAAHVLSTSTNTVRRLVDEGVLPIVPHMGQRVLIPRIAVVRLVETYVGLDTSRVDTPSPLRQWTESA